MALFLALGTAMAQDKDKEENTEPAVFELKSVSPDPSSPVSTVYYIRMSFTKNIEVTMPEGGIAVTNTETNESIKLTRSSAYDSDVAFMFEQIEVEGKDGKTELKDQDISTPGTYTYTIPAGVIKSVDGEEFPETTFTFTVGTPLSVVGYQPWDSTDKLEKIELTFNMPIASVVMPEGGMAVVDYYTWSPVANVKDEVVISEDKMTVTLELDDPVTAAGVYCLDVYSNVFIGEAGQKNQSSTCWFNVVPPYTTNLQDGSRVKEIGNLEITVNGATEIVLAEDKVVTAYIGGSDIPGTATLEGNVITVTFEQELTEEGDYMFLIPAGLFTMDGVANEESIISVTLETLSITPLEIVGVTPEVGTVEQLDKIIIRFNQPIALSLSMEDWLQISREIMLTCGDQTYTLTYDPGFSSNATPELTYLVNAEWNGYEYTSTPITAAGTYTLNLADIVVDYAVEQYIDQYGYTNTKWNVTNYTCSGTYTWTIEEGGDNAIEGIEATEGEQEIYDLLGRRVEKITGAGIYIVNGKKVVIK